MSQKFDVELTINNGVASVKLAGRMDEDMDLEKIKAVSEPQVNFDFKEVESINSCGIRDWINFLGEIPKSHGIIYKNCPQVIIEQMNMVKGFLPSNSKIESFFAPFFCEACEHEEKILLTPEQINDKKAPHDISCPKCSSVGMDFDAIAAQYFHFLD